MHVEDMIPFEQVRDTFLRANPDPTFGATGYASGLLDAANKQFLGEGHRAVLSHEDTLGVMLPWHFHQGFELIPPSGLMLSEALPRLELAAPSHECRQRIEQ